MLIHNSGIKEESLNYRPVSLTSIVCKISETIFNKQWIEYLEREDIKIDRQFGLRIGRSCVINLLHFYLRMIDISQEDVTKRWMDLKKAFDKVLLRRLL